jgi:cell fate (sporulation/competence/biofilm development) regulator YlbF (YheA/YmcA/DUF963 family)
MKLNAKEQAKELIAEFEYQDNFGITENTGIKGIDYETAKQIALKAVDEILKAVWEIHTNVSEFRYWQEVKTEIKNL